MLQTVDKPFAALRLVPVALPDFKTKRPANPAVWPHTQHHRLVEIILMQEEKREIPRKISNHLSISPIPCHRYRSAAFFFVRGCRAASRGRTLQYQPTRAAATSSPVVPTVSGARWCQYSQTQLQGPPCRGQRSMPRHTRVPASHACRRQIGSEACRAWPWIEVDRGTRYSRCAGVDIQGRRSKIGWAGTPGLVRTSQL